MMEKSEKIFVAGHRGMVGSALIRGLESEGFSNLLVCDRSKLDLRDEIAIMGHLRSGKAWLNLNRVRAIHSGASSARVSSWTLEASARPGSGPIHIE